MFLLTTGLPCGSALRNTSSARLSRRSGLQTTKVARASRCSPLSPRDRLTLQRLSAITWMSSPTSLMPTTARPAPLPSSKRRACPRSGFPRPHAPSKTVRLHYCRFVSAVFVFHRFHTAGTAMSPLTPAVKTDSSAAGRPGPARSAPGAPLHAVKAEQPEAAPGSSLCVVIISFSHTVSETTSRLLSTESGGDTAVHGKEFWLQEMKRCDKETQALDHELSLFQVGFLILSVIVFSSVSL